MKSLFWTFCLFLLMFPVNVCALPDEVNEIYEASGADTLFEKSETGLSDFDAKEIAKSLAEGNGFDFGDIVKDLFEKLLKGFKENIKLCFSVVAIGYLMGMFSQMQNGVGGAGITACANIACYCVFAGVLAGAFSIIAAEMTELMGNLFLTVKALIPILITLLTVSGGVVSGGLLATFLIGGANIVVLILETFVVPLIYCSLAISIASNMSDKIRLTNAVPFMHKIVKWVLLFIMITYTGIIGIYSMSGAPMDMATGKIAKFVIGSGVPVVGGIAADSFSTVVATIAAGRSLIGVTGIILVIGSVAAPMLEIISLMLVFKFCAVVLEPFSSTGTVRLVSDVSACLSMLFAVLVAVGVVFVSGIGVILLTGNFIVR